MDLDAASMDQRTRLLNGTDRLAESSRRLQDSHKIALETGMSSIIVLDEISTAVRLIRKLTLSPLDNG